jgi:hypothetical protein
VFRRGYDSGSAYWWTYSASSLSSAMRSSSIVAARTFPTKSALLIPLVATSTAVLQASSSLIHCLVTRAL